MLKIKILHNKIIRFYYKVIEIKIESFNLLRETKLKSGQKLKKQTKVEKNRQKLKKWIKNEQKLDKIEFGQKMKIGQKLDKIENWAKIGQKLKNSTKMGKFDNIDKW